MKRRILKRRSRRCARCDRDISQRAVNSKFCALCAIKLKQTKYAVEYALLEAKHKLERRELVRDSGAAYKTEFRMRRKDWDRVWQNLGVTASNTDRNGAASLVHHTLGSTVESGRSSGEDDDRS